MECEICFDKYNKSTRKKVECIHCNESCCTKCFGRYLLECQQENPSCMSCKNDISQEFLYDNMTKKFMDTYRDHMTAILMEREKSLLPETQPFAEYYKLKEKYAKDVREINDKIDKLQMEIYNLSNNSRTIHRQINAISYDLERGVINGTRAERKEFLMKCVQTECKGYLSSAWKCGLCESYVCSKCHGIKKERNDDTHTCDEDTVATISLLKTDTKPCPGDGCGVPIHKIDGCDQMYCTSCDTAFSWRTLEIQRGRIHNPHYYERLRILNNGVIPRENGDTGPGQRRGCNDMKKLQKYVENAKYKNQMSKDFDWKLCHRMIYHIRDVIMPRYRTQFTPQTNLLKRVYYLCNELTEDDFYKHIKSVKKKSEKEAQYYNIMEMCTDTLQDLWNAFEDSGGKTDIEKQTTELRIYANTAIILVNKKFNCKMSLFMNNWDNRA